MAFVQGAAGSNTPGVTDNASAIFGSNVTAGNLIVVSFTLNEIATISSVADGLGNTYTQVDFIENLANGVTHYKYYAQNISGGACTITVTTSATRLINVAAEEYSGMATSGVLDQTAKAQSASTTPSSGNIATTTANQLLHCSVGVANGATITAGTDFTLRQQEPTGAGAGRTGTEDRTVTSTGTYSGGFTLDPSRDWACIIASFKEAAGGGEPPASPPAAEGQPFHRRFWGIPGHAGYNIGGHH